MRRLLQFASYTTFESNSDDPTIVTLARVGSGAVSEGDGIEFTVTLSRELVAGEIIEVPVNIIITSPQRGEFRLSKKRGRGLNTGVKLLYLGGLDPSVRFTGAGARVARLVLTPLHDDNATEGTETFMVALDSDTHFDNSIWTNVGGGADPHASQNSFSVAVRDVGVPARCTTGFPGCVWVTGGGRVTEGGNVTFTVHADPAPPGDPAQGHGLEVKLNVFDAEGFQDYLNFGDTFFRTVKIPAGQTSASFTVPTADDRFDEEDGAVRAQLSGVAHRGRRGPGRNGEYYYWARNPRVAWVNVADNDIPPPPHIPSVVNVSAERRFIPLINKFRSDGTRIGKPIVATGDKVAAGEEARFCIGRDSGAGRLMVTTEYVYRTTGSTDPWTRIGGTHGVQLSSRTQEVCLELDTTGRAGQTVGLRLVPARQRFELHGARLVTPYVAGSNAIATREVTGAPVSTVSFTGGDRSVSEGAAPLELSMSLDPPPPAPVTLRFRVSGRIFTREAFERDYKAGRARWASDYYIQSRTWNRTLKVPADAATATLTMHVIDDDKPDSGETVEIEVLAGDRVSPHATLGSMTVTILNHEAPPGQKGGYRQQLTEADWTDYRTVVNFLVEVRDNPKNTAVKGNPVHIAKWNRVLATIGHASPEQPMAASDIHANTEKWPDSPFRAASAYLKSLDNKDPDDTPPDTPPVTLPAVSVTGGAAVTEGGDAVFTVTATPAPSADLPVTVAVATDGDYGISAGSRTVTVPTTGSTTLTLPTTGDATDEPDGSVTATVTDGSGYTVGSPASGSVTVRDDDDTPPDTPEITVTAGDAVTEGGDAAFTLTANPAPAADLPVSVTVATDGDYGITAGTQTVTIPTTGSYTLTLATTDDATDEPDGSATVTVQAGNGYMVGASASGTVAVRDDDLPPPAVSIAAKAASVTEGGDAVFTLTADRSPDADLSVTLSVSETGEGDHVAASDEGPATAVIAKGATEAVFTLATVSDDLDEPDGSVVVAVQAGAGYAVGNPASASVEVKDDDAPSTVPALSVADSTAKEGDRLPVMPFTVRLSSPAPGPVRVYVSTRPSTPVSAQPGQDYAPGSYDLTFGAGETEKQVWIRIYDDSHDEGAETFEVVLSNARGAPIRDGVAVGTITNDDPMLAAWLSRFGRTVAEQALDGIAGRMSAPRTPGAGGTIAGQALTFDAADSAQPADWRAAADPFGAGGAQYRPITARELLLGSSFTRTGEKDASGGSLAFWGRAAQARFDGREGTFSLDGAVTTGMVGADYARGKWLIGLALARSAGEGDYRDTEVVSRAASQDCPAEAAELCRGAVREGDGKVESSLTAALPYGALQVSERLRLWGAAGYGAGEVTLETAMGGSYSADTTWSMAAAGMRGGLLKPGGGGFGLSVLADALWTRTDSEKTGELAASRSETNRLRLGIEGSREFRLESGMLTPRLEFGVRHDGGDADTGFGVEVGGGVSLTARRLGLVLDVSGRALLAHEAEDFRDRGISASLTYDPDPGSKRGASFALRRNLGASATGGLDALFGAEPLSKRAGGRSDGWRAEAAWGLPVFGGRFTGSPFLAWGYSAGARDYDAGWRLEPEAPGAPDLSLSLKATRREGADDTTDHGVGIDLTARW